jgi:uncharacterized membrane protein YfcA
MTTLLYLSVGLSIGVISGTLGIGGGVLLVPVLMWVFKFTQPEAAGTSLAVLVFPVLVLPAWKYYARGQVHLEAAVWIAGAVAVGSYAGALVVPYLPLPALRVFFGLIMIYVATRFLLASDAEAANAALGLGATAAAWVAYLGLRLLGRRHLRRPDLGQEIRRAEGQGGHDPDYYI